MFRILCDPSSGSTELCLTEITRSDSQIFCHVLGRCLTAQLRCQTPKHMFRLFSVEICSPEIHLYYYILFEVILTVHRR